MPGSVTDSMAWVPSSVRSLTNGSPAPTTIHVGGMVARDSTRIQRSHDGPARAASHSRCRSAGERAPARSERVAKYNQLLRIEEDLDSQGVYFGPAMAANWFDEKE